MFRTKLRIISISILSLVFCFALFLSGVFVYCAPDLIVSDIIVETAYKGSFDKKAVLEFYSPVNRQVGGGYMSPGVDEFLCRQIENTNDKSEIAAIVNFYTIQAGGREGRCIYNGSEQAKQKIIAQLIEDMNDDASFRSKMVLLEEVRRDKSLGKGLMGIGRRETDNPSTPDEWREWKDQMPQVARQKYRDWWNSGLSWEDKKKVDPLAGTNIRVYECCG